MWLPSMSRAPWTCSCFGTLCLLIIIGTVTTQEERFGQHIFPLLSKCKQYTMPYEVLIDKYTLFHLHDGLLDAALNCSLKLKTFPLSTIHIKSVEAQPPNPGDNCSTHLTLVEPGNHVKLMDNECVLPPSFTIPLSLQTVGNEVMAVFTVTKSPTSPKPTTLLFTTVRRECRPKLHFRCAPGDVCVDRTLMCDGLPQCPNGEDEKGCPHLATALYPTPSTTSHSPGSSITPEMEENIYLWLPLIVVIIFTVVMLVLILAGRRTANCSSNQRYRPTGNNAPSLTTWTPTTDTLRTSTTTPGQPGFGSERVDIITLILVAIVFVIILIGCIILGFREQKYRNEEVVLNDDLRLDTNLNPGFSDGGPPTPPPTYSMIERQTSYVSQISQTSSQISVPPDYEEAVDESEDPMSWRRRLRRHLSRSTSVTTGPSRRLRLFQRSMSAQESPSRRGRHSSDNTRPRHASDQNSHQSGSMRTSTTSDSDSVFSETPEQQHLNISPVSGNMSAPSMLENVSEVDETLGSSLMLSGDPAPDVTSGTDVTADSTGNIMQPYPALFDATQNASTLTHACIHPPQLQRSISDVMGGQVTFLLED